MNDIVIKYRIKYIKTGAAAWLSQLDMARNLERGLRRAELPLAYTQGYSPRPKISFGPALPLGVESRAEYADIRLTRPLPSLDIVDGLNHCLPRTMRIIAGRRLPDGAASIGKTVCEAVYKIFLSAAKKTDSDFLKLADNKIFLTNKNVEIKYKEGETKFVEFTEAEYVNDEKSAEVLFVVKVRAGVNIRPLPLAAATADKAAAAVKKILRWEQLTAAGEPLMSAVDSL